MGGMIISRINIIKRTLKVFRDQREGVKECFHPYRNTADVYQPTFLRGVDLLLSSLPSALSQSLDTNGLT